MDSRTKDVLVVARHDDAIALRLRRALEDRGCRVEYVDGAAASRLFTIRVGSGSAEVNPSMPIFARASAWWLDQAPANCDEVFLRSEEYATFWAAAALCSAPVVNRPGRLGAVNRITSGPIARTLRLDSERALDEVYASGPELLEDGDNVWGEDANYISGPIASLTKKVPVRARTVSAQALYEIVAVVGGRAFPATVDPRTADLDLPARSIDLARRASVHFAAITWAVTDGGAVPVRLNADPDENDIFYSWGEVADALCEDLTQ